MPVLLRLQCPCGSRLSVDVSHAGKRGSCPTCNRRFKIPSPTEHSPTQSVAAAAATNLLDPSNRSATELAERLKARKARDENSDKKSDTNLSEVECPGCGRVLANGAVVCIGCGYHTTLKRKLESAYSSQSVDANKESRAVASMSIYMAGLGFLIFASFWQRNIDGPTYIRFFFLLFTIAGLTTLVLRKIWLDVDTFNHVAMLIVVGIGTIRLFDSVFAGKFKLVFLMYGLVVAGAVFWLSRTETNLEQDNPFRNKQAGLAIAPYCALLTIGCIILALIFFVPQIGEAVAKFSIAGLMILGGLVFLAWAKLTGVDLSSGSGGGGYFDSCSSCSSCGGGGCGGGCGGCGG